MQNTLYRFLFAIIVIPVAVFSQPLQQKHDFTHADTLRGTITPERAWWDVTKYDLTVKFDFNKRTLEGRNIIFFNVVSAPAKEMQVDLQAGLDIDSAVMNGQRLGFRRDGNAYFISVPRNCKAARQNSYQFIIMAFHARPCGRHGTGE